MTQFIFLPSSAQAARSREEPTRGRDDKSRTRSRSPIGHSDYNQARLNWGTCSPEQDQLAWEQLSLCSAVGLYMSVPKEARSPRLVAHRRLGSPEAFAGSGWDVLTPAARGAYLLGAATERSRSTMKRAMRHNKNIVETIERILDEDA